MPDDIVPDTRKVCISAMGITALIILLLAGSAGADTFEQWSKTFGGRGNDSAFAVQQTSDSGYILAGKTQSYGAGESDAWLIKTDANGDELWNRTFGGKGIDEASSVQQTSDGGYILAGKTHSYGSGYGNAWLIKTDRNGKEQWNKTSGGMWAGSVQQTSDGGYVLAGMASLPTAPVAFWIIKTDSKGNDLWNRTFGGGRGDWANAVRQTSDGGYIIAGRRYVPGGSQVWLIKTDANGKEQWSKTFGGGGYDEALSIQQTLDAGYIVAGKKEYPRGNTNAWLIKIDSNGSEQWNRTFGGEYNDEASSALQTLDGGYIIAGSRERSYGDAVAWLIKTDANGNEQWNKTFEAFEGRLANSIQQTSDKGFVIAGDTFSDRTKSLDALLIKVREAPPQIKTEIRASEEKMLVVGGTWEKDGWNLSVKAVDKTAAPYFILISLSYQGKELEDARIETGKSITYRGRNPDGSEVNLFTAKVVNIFVGAGADAVRLKLDWTAPMNGVQILEAPVESEMQAETPVPTPTAQASPEAPGFEIVLGIMGILAVWWRLKK